MMREVGRLTSARLVHPEKAPPQTYWTPEPRAAYCSPVQPSKALEPMPVMPPVVTKLCSPVQYSKQWAGMLLTWPGKTAWVRPVQPENAPTSTDFRLLVELKSG